MKMNNSHADQFPQNNETVEADIYKGLPLNPTMWGDYQRWAKLLKKVTAMKR